MTPDDLLQVAHADIDEATAVLATLRSHLPTITELANCVCDCFKHGGKLLFCGNGGSACDSAHIAGEFTGRFKRERRPYPALALNVDGGLITCIANDYDYSQIFARPIHGLGQRADVVFFLTTSGNSSNIIAGIEAARTVGMTSVALLGKGGGNAKGMADIDIIIDSNTTARIQEAHKLLLHILCELVDRKLVG